MSGQVWVLVSRGILYCRKRIVNKIVLPLCLSIRTKDFTICMEEPFNPTVKIQPFNINTINLTPKQFHINLKKIDNISINLRKCKE